MPRTRFVQGLIAVLLLAGGMAYAAEKPCDAGLAPSQCPDKPELPASIGKLVPQGYEVLDYLGGQLTDAQRQDYLVVINHHVDTMMNASPRSLLIFTQQADGSYALAARNDAIIVQADEGGMGDPYTDSGEDGLAIKNRYFTVQQGVSGGISHYTDYVTFHYDVKHRDWLFHKEIFTDIQPSLDDPPKPVRSKVSKSDEQHPISFADWRPDYWCHPENANQNDPVCRDKAAGKGGHSPHH